MVERIGSQVTGGIVAGRRDIARIIGALVITLLAGSSAFGQFIVQPMKLVVPLPPGRRTSLEVTLENTTQNTIQTVDLRITDIAQDANAIWQAIEPDAEVVQGPNGTQMVNVGTDVRPNFVDISRRRSCQSWLRVVRNQVEIRPMNRVPVQLQVEVPAGTRGYYCAALLAQAAIGQREIQGYQSNIVLEFVVPIIIEVQGRPEQEDVTLTDVGLEFRPQDEMGPAATLVSLSVNNNGGTYSILKGYARIWGKLAGHWRKITDVEFPNDISIIPGVQFRLRTDVGPALGQGEYKVQGYLFVDGTQGADITKELTFKGDPRVRGPAKGTGALDLDPREVILVSQPGQTRAATLLVVNASDEPVNIDVSVALPDLMLDKVFDTLRGDQFDCTNWLEVTPTKFTLEGQQRVNLRIVSRMPDDAANANYYAMVRLHAQHTDGQEAGKTDSRVCIQNRKVPSNIRVDGMAVRLSEMSPSRYAVAAQFGNFGNAHVQPTCWAVLTAIPSNETVKKVNLSNDVLSQSGLMLPLETRYFKGVMDIGAVPPGTYRLTAALMYEKGDVVYKQTGLEVTATSNGKVIRQFEFSGPPIPIKL